MDVPDLAWLLAASLARSPASHTRGNPVRRQTGKETEKYRQKMRMLLPHPLPKSEFVGSLLC